MVNKETWSLIHAFERGVDDGFFRVASCPPENKSDDERSAYQRGYDHGVWMYCETLEEET